MRIQSVVSLALATLGTATPITLDFYDKRAPGNITYVPCTDGTTDPICLLIRQPDLDVISEIVHANGTVEIQRNLYTREQLRDIRARHNVVSVEHQPGQVFEDKSAEFVANLSKRESAPPICYTETQKWFDQNEWGYWYQAWHQVGNCFYCDQCTEAIAVSFAVTETWTAGLSYKFNDVITATFSFTWGETFSLTDTRTCQWNNVESGCHSIWYQPLMSYHNGYPNYQSHTHCSAAAGQPPTDTYYDHNYVYANVNQAGNNGVNQGNLGCNSGCQGNDHRQCQNGNNGGALWPNAN